MSKKGNTAVIGAFVIGAIVLAVVGILAFGSGALFKKTDTFVLFFDGDLKGLSVGALVLLSGVPVGAVKDIRVYYKSSQAEFRIPVFIETDPARFHDLEDSKDLVPDEIDPPELDRLIKAGLRGRLTLQSPVTGQLAVLLDLLPDTPVNLQGDGRMPEIPTVPSSIERLAGALEKLDLGTLVANVNRAMAALDVNHGDRFDHRIVEIGQAGVMGRKPADRDGRKGVPHRIEQFHARRPVPERTHQRQQEVNEPEGARGFRDARRHLVVLRDARRFGFVQLHATDAQQRDIRIDRLKTDHKACLRACATKQSSNSGHSEPRQLSVVEVTSGSRPLSSLITPAMDRSPSSVRADQSSTASSSVTAPRVGKRPSVRANCMRCRHR